MKQLFQNLRSGETVVVDVPIPTPQHGEALVQTCASLVSAGTERTLVEFAEKSLVGKVRSRPDLARQILDKARREGILTTLDAAFNRLDQPMPLGYSSAGVIRALGEGVQGFHVGQRVACAGGNYAVHAEYVTVPPILLTPLPENVGFDPAAFTTLGAIAMHGFRLAQPQIGERLAVIGLGLLGLLMTGIARAGGCRVLGVDLDPWRVSLAKGMGAQAVTRPEAEEAAASFSGGRGCDAVLICADTLSDDPVELAGAIARDRARVVAVGAVGLHIPRKIYYEKELSFINSRSYGPGRYDPSYEEGGHDYPIGFVRWTEGRNMEAFVDLLSEGCIDVQPLITHRFPIEKAPEAYELITGKKGEPFLGVLITYQDSGREDAEVISVPVGDAKIDHPDTPRTAIPASQQVDAVKLGMLGAGNFATAIMLPAIGRIPNIERVGIASAGGASARYAANRFDFRYATGDEARILQDPEINTVAILTRHHQHARQVVIGLNSGKNVFCEKPLAVTPGELEEIRIALDREKCPLLCVGFNRRFAPLAVRLKEFVEVRKEPLVVSYRINAGYIPLTHWSHDPVQGGGRIIGEGCHFIDFLSYLVGASPVSVSASGLPDQGRYREDNVLLHFSYPDGSLGTISYLANGDKAFPKERIEVFTGGRIAVLDDFRLLELVQSGRRKSIRSLLRQEKGHREIWQAFVAALTSGDPAPIPYDHLIGVTRASFAAVHALRSGEKVRL